MNRLIPEVIYLQWYGADQRDLAGEDGEPDDVTWCQDRINDTDVVYQRVRKHTQETTDEN